MTDCIIHTPPPAYKPSAHQNIYHPDDHPTPLHKIVSPECRRAGRELFLSTPKQINHYGSVPP